MLRNPALMVAGLRAGIATGNPVRTRSQSHEKTGHKSGSFMAGDESDGWHPLLSDFILLGQKLEQLGFTYFKGTVTVMDPSEMR